MISEGSCEIPLQSLLDHTVQRIFLIPGLKFETTESSKFEILYKWGCDGSGGHSRYKQEFNENPGRSDENIFMASLVPLHFRCHNEKKNDYQIIWENPLYSSTRFYRPIMFEYIKETIESTKQVVEKIENQIKKLNPTLISIGCGFVSVTNAHIRLSWQ